MKTRAAVQAIVLGAIVALFVAPAPGHAHDGAAFSRAELDAMLAPVALYPDTVLSHVLIAATYPEEVAEAARWSRSHPDLEGEDAVEAVEGRDWNPSVKALVAFPEILARMDENPDWTERLGDAFLAQEADVMDSVQGLRDRAYEAGHLDSLEHVRVVREREYIYLEPAVAHVVYVPYYDPWWVYGTWWWASYPPHCWSYWHGRPVRHYASYGRGFYWGVGFNVWPTFYSSSFDWPARHVVVVQHQHRPATYYSGRDVARHREARHWRRDPGHAAHAAAARLRVQREAVRTSADRDVRTPARSEVPRDRSERHGRQERHERQEHKNVARSLGQQRNEARRDFGQQRGEIRRRVQDERDEIRRVERQDRSGAVAERVERNVAPQARSQEGIVQRLERHEPRQVEGGRGLRVPQRAEGQDRREPIQQRGEQRREERHERREQARPERAERSRPQQQRGHRGRER